MQTLPVHRGKVERLAGDIAVQKPLVVACRLAAVIGRLQIGAHHARARHQTVAGGAGLARDFQPAFIGKPLERPPERRRADIRRDMTADILATGAGMVRDVVEYGLVRERHETIRQSCETIMSLKYMGLSELSRYRFTENATIRD